VHLSRRFAEGHDIDRAIADIKLAETVTRECLYRQLSQPALGDGPSIA
jgi:hypothetical protein